MADNKEKQDTWILDALLCKATLGTTEDGELCIWRNHTGREDEPALAIICEGTGDDGEITAEDAPFLTEEQRGHLNGSIPHAVGSVDDPQTVRAALAFALGIGTSMPLDSGVRLYRSQEETRQEWPPRPEGHIHGLFARGDGKMRIWADPTMPSNRIELRDDDGRVRVVMNNTGVRPFFDATSQRSPSIPPERARGCATKITEAEQ